MKAAVVDVGGGLRGIYAIGVLDRCLEEGIHFDAGFGVSAGSANIASYLTGQKRPQLSVLCGIFSPQGIHEPTQFLVQEKLHRYGLCLWYAQQ